MMLQEAEPFGFINFQYYRYKGSPNRIIYHVVDFTPCACDDVKSSSCVKLMTILMMLQRRR